MERADVVIAIGSSLTRTPFGPGVPADKVIIHSTNEPGDINKDYAARLGLVGDAALVIEALIEEIGRQGMRSSRSLETLKGEISAVQKSWQEEWATEFDSDEEPLNQYRVIRDMMRVLDRDEVIITHDSGGPREQLLPFWQSTVAGSYLGWGKSTQLGYGLGLIMGAKLAQPDKVCINVMGDSSFGMTGLDIETAARNDIGILTVVFNNQMMAAERDVLKVSEVKYGALAVGGNYAKVAEGLGVASERVTTPAGIAPAFKAAVEQTRKGKPCLLEFVVKEGSAFSRYNLAGL